MNKKKIIRDQRIEIKMSKEEKELFKKYAENIGINTTRLARNILLEEAGKNFISRGIEKTTIQAYKKYLEITKQFDILERIKQD